MRFRKYSRKHAFNILYQWDITGEPIETIAKNYWKTLEESYNHAKTLAEELLKKIESGQEFDTEVYAKKFENLSEEEILADKLRKALYIVYALLKSIDEFHNFSLTFTEWLSEKSKKRKEKALNLLEELKKNFKNLKRIDKERRELFEELIKLIQQIEEKLPQNFEQLKDLENDFRQKILEIVKTYLKEIIEFSQKRVSEDMGEIRDYATNLLDAYSKHRLEIDSLIEEFLKGWTLDRLGSIERNLLRLGAAEFTYVGVQDPGRAFNDYIDFAKAFVNQKAAKFVNGVLSAIYNRQNKNGSSQ